MKHCRSATTLGSDESDLSIYSSYSSGEPGRQSKAVSKIKLGLRKSNPAAIVLWAFHKNPSQRGLTSRMVIEYLKKNRYTFGKRPKRAGKTIGSMLRCAAEFGLIKKKGNRYYLAKQ